MGWQVSDKTFSRSKWWAAHEPIMPLCCSDLLAEECPLMCTLWSALSKTLRVFVQAAVTRWACIVLVWSALP